MKHVADIVEIGSLLLIGVGVMLQGGLSLALIVVGVAIYVPAVITGLRSNSDD